MAAEDLVRYEVHPSVATITLDSPDNRNALSRRLMYQLADRLEQARSDDDVRVVVLSHTGTTFSSGMDLTDPAVNVLPPILQAIWDSPKPVVARVGGAARAGGIGLLAACDIAVAATNATFAFTEARVGAVPAVISVVVLPLIGRRAAGELFLTGEPFDGARAAQIGLVTVAARNVDAEVARYVELLLLGAPGALAETKRVLRPDRLDFAAMTALSAQRFASDEAREGMAAFREKRRPAWAQRPGGEPPPPPQGSFLGRIRWGRTGRP